MKNWITDESGKTKRKCENCDGTTFSLFLVARPIKGTLGYRVECIKCNSSRTLKSQANQRTRRTRRKSK